VGPLERPEVARLRIAVTFLLLVVGGLGAVMYSAVWSQVPETGPGVETVAVIEGTPVWDVPSQAGGTQAAATPRQTPPADIWYQYTDERGSVHFANSLGEVPPQWRERAGRVEMSTRDPVQVASVTQRTRRPRPRRPESDEQVWGGQPAGEVIIYTTPWCGYCRKAIAHLEDRGVDYVNKDIEADADAEEEYLEKSGGRRGVPLIDVGGQIMQGYSRAALDRMLDAI
jgi:glutaredoxin